MGLFYWLKFDKYTKHWRQYMVAILKGGVSLRGVTISQLAGPLLDKIWSSAYQFSDGTNVGGYFQAAAIDSTNAVITVGSMSGAYSYVTVAKWDKTGILQWQKQIGDPTGMGGEIVTVDSSDNVYVFASDYNTLSTSIAFFKFDTNGNLVAQKNLASVATNGTGSIVGNAIVLSDGIILTYSDTGAFTSTMLKLDFSGNQVWIHSLYDGLENVDSRAAQDSSGNIFFQTVNNGDPNTGININKYNSSMALQWSKRLTNTVISPAPTTLGGMALDSSGNIYLCVTDTAIKLDSSGALVWAKQFTGAIATGGLNFLTVKSSGNSVYFAGTGSVIKYDAVSNTFIYAYAFNTPTGAPNGWWNYSSADYISVNSGYIAMGAYNISGGSIFKAPTDLNTYSNGLASAANRYTILPVSYTIIDLTSDYVVNTYSPSAPSNTNTITTTTFTNANAVGISTGSELLPVATPVANFTGTPTSGVYPYTVSFTDTSANIPTSWLWNFGDGYTSTLQNPVHSWTPGTYTVSLQATNSAGTNTYTATNYITSTPSYQGIWNALANTPAVSSGSGPFVGAQYIVGVSGSQAGIASGVTLQVGDYIKWNGTSWVRIAAGSTGGATIYKGAWNPNTNTPTLADGTGVAGYMYLVSAAGTVNLGSGNITFAINDYAIYNGTVWQKLSAYNGGFGTPLMISVAIASPAPMSLNLGNYNVTVDWGNGNVIAYDSITNPVNYTYPTPGSYTISVHGTADAFNGISGSTTNSVLTAIDSFGGIGITNLNSACKNAENLTSVPAFLPPTVTILSSMFYMDTFYAYASIFNSSTISSWDTTYVTDMSYMFNMNSYGSAFNQPLNSWNVSSVTNMRSMFSFCSVFNQNLNSWNVSNVTDMGDMFSYCAAFNGNITSWNTGNVTNMNQMFVSDGAFNQNIGSWNVSNVTNTDRMFQSATSFNQPLNSWNVGKVTSMSGMFAAINDFNQNIGSWNVSNVTNMSNMFNGSGAFNQSLNSWNVSKVTDMSSMFKDAYAFNQPLNSWNVSNVTSMADMFSSFATSYTHFDQNISSWSVLTHIPTYPTNFATNSPLDPHLYPANNFKIPGGTGWSSTW
jgi:surface protein